MSWGFELPKIIQMWNSKSDAVYESIQKLKSKLEIGEIVPKEVTEIFEEIELRLCDLDNELFEEKMGEDL